MSIHKETIFPVSPDRIYEVLTRSAEFEADTGKPARINDEIGGDFSIFGGYICGRQIELVPGKRVVQAWRGMDWAPGVYSIVRFTLTEADAGTKLQVDHDSYPEGPSPMYPTWHE